MYEIKNANKQKLREKIRKTKWLNYFVLYVKITIDYVIINFLPL